MSYVVVASVAMAASQAGQSQPVWKWVPDTHCELRQQLPGRRSIEIWRNPTYSSTVISFHDLDAAIRDPQALQSIQLALDSGGIFAGVGGIGPGEHRRSRSVHVFIDGPEFLQQLSQASRLTVSHAAFGSLRFEIRSLGAAVQALRKCERDKMREWGIDPDQLASLRSPPIPLSPTHHWFSTDDYPSLASMFGVGGLVTARVDVGADGAIRGCRVVDRRALTDFHAAVCGALTKRGKFKPAIDAAGQPTPAPYVVNVRFSMPR